MTTFGGHPVSCAAAHAALTVLLRGWMRRAPVIEARIRQALGSFPGVVEIRGRGAMLGLQLGSFEQTQAFVEGCFKQGILLGWTLHSNTLVRLAPPLTIPDDVLDATLDVMRAQVMAFPAGLPAVSS